MKKSFVILITMALLSFGLTGCDETKQWHEEYNYQSEHSMFINIEGTDFYNVVYHEDTKVMYAISRGVYNQGTFTVLLNPDGTPMLYEGN